VVRTLEDREIDAFLDDAHKKRVSHEIRQRKWEKKLHTESIRTRGCEAIRPS